MNERLQLESEDVGPVGSCLSGIHVLWKNKETSSSLGLQFMTYFFMILKLILQ